MCSECVVIVSVRECMEAYELAKHETAPKILRPFHTLSDPFSFFIPPAPKEKNMPLRSQ